MLCQGAAEEEVGWASEGGGKRRLRCAPCRRSQGASMLITTCSIRSFDIAAVFLRHSLIVAWRKLLGSKGSKIASKFCPLSDFLRMTKIWRRRKNDNRLTWRPLFQQLRLASEKKVISSRIEAWSNLLRRNVAAKFRESRAKSLRALDWNQTINVSVSVTGKTLRQVMWNTRGNSVRLRKFKKCEHQDCQGWMCFLVFWAVSDNPQPLFVKNQSQTLSSFPTSCLRTNKF